jgi:hypothetical protein
MNSNAMQALVVPVVRGVFLIIMLGAGARGLVRMVGMIAASARHPDDPATAAVEPRSEAASAADLALRDETPAGVLA